jgi:transcriptional regulator with XRE-family HTH domain
MLSCGDCFADSYAMRIKGPNPVDLLVGSRIRHFRRRRKMSQAQLGDALGVTFQQIQKYENGKNRVSASRLQMVSTALGVPVAELFVDGTGTIKTSATARAIAFDPQALRFAEAFVKLIDKDLRASMIEMVEAMARKSTSR